MHQRLYVKNNGILKWSIFQEILKKERGKYLLNTNFSIFYSMIDF